MLLAAGTINQVGRRLCMCHRKTTTTTAARKGSTEITEIWKEIDYFIEKQTDDLQHAMDLSYQLAG